MLMNNDGCMKVNGGLSLSCNCDIFVMTCQLLMLFSPHSLYFCWTIDSFIMSTILGQDLF